VDLPGLGLTAGSPTDWSTWLDGLLTSASVRQLVGHSIGAAAALDFAARHPGRIDQLTLVAPFFLQEASGVGTPAAITRAYLRHAGPQELSRRLTGTAAHAELMRHLAVDLRRGRAARHTAALLRRSRARHWRAALQQQLSAYRGDVHIVVGLDDPLAAWAGEVLRPLGSRLRTTTIADAGHHPQLTHPMSLARAIGSEPANTAEPAGPGWSQQSEERRGEKRL
jgi:pimeloyl-ACP methyl ester carboxylesterase